jgi:hypothetical protein
MIVPSTDLLAFALCGAAVVAGLVALWAYLRGSEPRTGRGGRPDGERGLAVRLRRAWYGTTGTPNPRTVRLRRIQVGLSLLGGAGGWLYTGVPLSVLLVPVLVFALPWLLDSTRSQTDRIERLEALAEWTQRLADVLLLGVGLEAAVVSSRRTAPAALEREINDLAGRLQARWAPADALRAFADALDDSTADKVLAALLLRATDRGPGLARALGDLAESVREEVRQRRAIEADRAKHRATVRWMVLIILGVVAVGSLNHRYTAPYGSALGQLVLLVLAAAFFAVVLWMRSLAGQKPVPRFLERDRRSRAGLLPRRRAAEPDGEGGGAGGPSPDGLPAPLPSGTEGVAGR